MVTSDKHFHIIIRDKNDAVPRFTVDRFTGTIEEEQTPSEFMSKYMIWLFQIKIIKGGI